MEKAKIVRDIVVVVFAFGLIFAIRYFIVKHHPNAIVKEIAKNG